LELDSGGGNGLVLVFYWVQGPPEEISVTVSVGLGLGGGFYDDGMRQCRLIPEAPINYNLNKGMGPETKQGLVTQR
jgi:hypothetical protein